MGAAASSRRPTSRRIAAAADRARVSGADAGMLTAFAEQAVNGLMMGSIYVFVALGMMLIYGVMHVLNFAHGALFMLGAYVAQTVFTKVIGNYPVSVFAAALLL